MNIQEVRRANLREWTESHAVPAKEKSYFSQLLGGASFGERAARRLEHDYAMGAGCLDKALIVESADATSPGSARTQLLRVLEGYSDEKVMHIVEALTLLLRVSDLPLDRHRVGKTEAMIPAPSRKRSSEVA